MEITSLFVYKTRIIEIVVYKTCTIGIYLIHVDLIASDRHEHKTEVPQKTG